MCISRDVCVTCEGRVLGRKTQSKGSKQERTKAAGRTRAQTTGQEQSKKVRFGKEEQPEETLAWNTDKPEVKGGFAEVKTGRGSAGFVRGEHERCLADETSGKGKERER